MSEQLQQQFDAQQERIQKLFDVVLDGRKETQTNADTLHNLLVGIENLGKNVKNMQEEMITWQAGYQDAEREYQDMNEELLQEVPLPTPASRPEVFVNPPPVSIPPAMTSQFKVLNAEHVPQLSAGPSMDESIQARWAKVSTLRKSYPGAPPPANWVPEGFNISKSANQASQATTPQFVNFIGSSSGMPQDTVQNPTNIEGNTSIFNLPQTVGFPPVLLEAYSQQMKEVSGPTKPQPTVSEKENSMQDEDQYSGKEISPGEAARIREEVQGVMKQQFAQVHAHAEAISNLERKLAAQKTISKFVNAVAEEEKIIDLISKSAASLQKSPPSVLPSSPISVASNPSHVGNGGSALRFLYLSSESHPSPPLPLFATMYWKPKEPPCFFGRSSEDAHTWTSLVRHYLTFVGDSDAQQVTYSVTLLRESAHEWYIGYERRHRNPPNDWARLCNLLLERLGSNIYSQEV